MAKLTREDVAHVALLARLDITDEEAVLYAEQLSAVLQHASEIDALDINDVPPTSHALPLENVVREDEPKPTLDRDEVLAQAPQAVDNRFGVPRILAEEP